MPRPFDFRQDIADEICQLLISGESLRRICENEAMPSRGRVFQWLAENDTFANQYARAREMQTEALVEECLEIADDPEIDAAQARIRIDTRKWLAGKLRPKKYGDKLDVDVAGSVTINIAADDAGLL
jgi:hypothetical protein